MGALTIFVTVLLMSCSFWVGVLLGHVFPFEGLYDTRYVAVARSWLTLRLYGRSTVQDVQEAVTFASEVRRVAGPPLLDVVRGTLRMLR